MSIRIIVLALIVCSIAACQQQAPPPPAFPLDSLITRVDTIHTAPEKADTTVKDTINPALLPGKWLQPTPGLENQLQGFVLETKGKATSVNLHDLVYEKWRFADDTLQMWSYDKSDTTELVIVDTFLVRTLTDTTLVLFPKNAAKGYFEQYKRKKKK
ncbi:lipocalin-like protein [Chitinophaga skermanii]|uniref:Lipocalin-like protein n=1 Tax=Chitinophaga skermanii TaxID=331697 RepID=A0A327QC46_9BACT|nr:lipocalin family protein [Chitinophaga skermanii]RAJ01545.1 lipocalin-like protein [Chitinophaga skermanii]